MEIRDAIYGKEEINDAVLVELINSKAIQRLKKVSQWRLPSKYYHLKNGYSRYDHSIGVLILLRRLGADIKEQIAGLLHDVSHTTFSHLIDWIQGDPSRENYQDSIFGKIVNSSDASEILNVHGFDVQDFLELEKFSLLEKKPPFLCADRIDYTLRDLVIEDFGLAKNLFEGLVNHNQSIVFSSKEKAKTFAEIYVSFQRDHWGGMQARARYYVFSEILKKALDKGIIKHPDFMTVEDKILSSLESSDEPEILENLRLLERDFEVKKSGGSEGIYLKKKFRYIDPGVLIEGKVKRLTEISSDYDILLKKARQRYKEDILETKFLISKK